MKTLKKIRKVLFIFLAGIIFPLSSGATEILKISTPENSAVIRLEINDPSLKDMDVILFDPSDKPIFRDRIDAGSTFESSYDFSGSQNGTYRLVSEMGHMKFNRIISVSNSTIELVDSYYSFSPQFDLSDETMMISYVNPESKDIGIVIERKEGNSIIFEDYHQNAPLHFSKSLALHELTRGDYQLILSSAGEFYSYDFFIE